MIVTEGMFDDSSDNMEEFEKELAKCGTPPPDVETKDSEMKSSWSGWFRKMNDAVLGTIAPPPKEENEESKSENTGEADAENKGSSWGAWGTSILQQAKEKTKTTLELVKKDLTEFSDVVQNETAHIVTATATTIRERAPQFMENIVGTVNTLLVDDTTKGEEESEISVTAAGVYGNRTEARLYAIQSDPGTYCSEPAGAPELFDDWLDHVFRLEEKKEEISSLLVSNPTVRNMFAQLVPSQVSNTLFWQRYFYKLHQFELDEARRRALLQREQVASLRGSNENTKLSWGDESDPDNPKDEAFYDVAKDINEENEQSQTGASSNESNPLCGREPPEGVSAIPKSWSGERCDSFNVEMKNTDDKDKNLTVQPPSDLEICSISSVSTPPRNDGEISPTDKKSDDWVEWEPN